MKNGMKVYNRLLNQAKNHPKVAHFCRNCSPGLSVANRLLYNR